MKLNSYFLPALLALLLHAAVFAVLADVWFQTEPERKVVPRHVSAQIVDLKALAAHERQAQQAAKAAADAKKREQEIVRKREAEAAKQREIARKKQEAQQLAKREAERKAAEQRKQDQARKKAEEKKRADALAARKAAEAKAQADAKALAEAKAKAQREAQEKQRAADKAAELARLAALDKAREDALAAALDEEEAALAGEAGRQAAMGYMDYIRQTIERNWRISPSARNGMEVEIAIHLLPSGEVDNAYITNSSGDERFDRDALRAVEKAGSFPELQKLEPVLFDRYYRRFTMRFRPDSLRY